MCCCGKLTQTPQFTFVYFIKSISCFIQMCLLLHFEGTLMCKIKIAGFLNTSLVHLPLILLSYNLVFLWGVSAVFFTRVPLQLDLRHSRQQSFFNWTLVFAASDFIFFFIVFISKQIENGHGEVILAMWAVGRECLLSFSLCLVVFFIFYFFVARNKPGMFFFFLHTGLAVGHECGGWTRTWLCGLQAIVSRLLSRPSSKLLLGFIVRPLWCPSVQGLLSNFPELQCAVGWGVSKQSQLQMMLSAVQTKKENQRHEPQVKTCQVSLHCKSSLFWITHQAM